jgi:hypothetical protein
MRNKEFYRIKDLNTELYYSSRSYSHGEPSEYDKNTTLYQYVPPKSLNYPIDVIVLLKFDEIGHFYPTKKGAERIVSEFVGCSIHQRKTKAGRILNSKFNFVVVKSQMKVEDIKE